MELETDKYGFIDKTGKEIIPIQYDWANDFKDNLAAVKKGDKWYLIDETGKEILEINFD